MKPEITVIPQIEDNVSVICITAAVQVPAFLKLTEDETQYALQQLNAGEEYVFINSYRKAAVIVHPKEDTELYKSREALRRTAWNLRNTLKNGLFTEVIITSDNAWEGAVEDFALALTLSFYSFSKYRSDDKEGSKAKYPSRLLLHNTIDNKSVHWLKEVTDAVWFSRNLINEPVNHLNAPALAEEIRKTGESAGFSVDILTKGKIEALKMGGLLAVNKGSVDPPVFCILEWKPETYLNKKPIILVGKGIVYDTGGLNLKTGEFMAGMNGDMAGAAIVNGVMHVMAKTGVPLHIIALIPSTDNRPGGNAYTQGDIIRMHNNLSVEVANTDAEGRLILADAISYASKYEPELIIDVATLTGSAAMTFGNQAIAVMTNAERRYYSLLEECGRDTYERIAELPLWEEYGELIKSEVADMKNVGGREGGAIIAGKFLERFTSFPLIHMDIAGTEIQKKDNYYKPANGSATGLRLLSEFLRRLAATY